jgi:hypothetical protein
MKTTCWTAAAAALLLAACGDGTGPRVPSAVEVVPQTLALETSDTVTVQAVLVDQAGRPYTTLPPGYQITWSSSAPLVADVQNGLVQALRPGQTIIRARAGDLAPAQIQVTVSPRTVTGQMAFVYDGFQTGTFAVDATFRLDQLDWNGDWALSWLTDEPDESGAVVRYHDFWAQQARSDGTVDWIVFWTVGEVTATGTWDIDGGLFFTGEDLVDGSLEAVYFGAGLLNITVVGDRRLAGTFAMDMDELDENNEPTGEILDIRSGTFDIPVILFPTEVSGDVPDAPPAALELPARPHTLRQSLRPRN